MFLLVLTYRSSPGSKAVNQLRVCVCACVRVCVRACVCLYSSPEVKSHIISQLLEQVSHMNIFYT